MDAAETSSDEDEQIGVTPQVEEVPPNNSGGDDDDDQDDAQLYTNMTVKEILSSLGTRGKAIPMPSTVRRNEERKRKRNRRREMESEDNQEENGSTGANESEENGSKNAQTPGEGEGESGYEDENEESASPAPAPGNVMAPQLVIDENGNIVIDQSSLVISSGTAAPAGAELNAGTTTIDLSYGRKVTSATYSKREKATKWKTADTVKFYLALRAYGTDFSTMSRIFPGRSRKQLRNKFKKEEKVSLEEINSALNNPMGAAEVERVFGEDLRKVEAKEKEEEERLRVENEQDGILANVNQAIDIDDDGDDNNEGCAVPQNPDGVEGETEVDNEEEKTNPDEVGAQDEEENDNDGKTSPANNENDKESGEEDEGHAESPGGDKVVEESDGDNEGEVEGGNGDDGVPDDDIGDTRPTADKDKEITKANVDKPEGESGGDECGKISESTKKGEGKKRKNVDEIEGESKASDEEGIKEGDEGERVDEVDDGEEEDEVGNTTNEKRDIEVRKRRKAGEKKRPEDEEIDRGTRDDGGDQVDEDGGAGGTEVKKVKAQGGWKRTGGAVRKSTRKKTRRKK